MKIITIMGSPRKKGNTAAVLAIFEEQVATKHQVERINITDHKINGCLGCDGCQPTLDAAGCKQKDDAVAILNRLIAADAIVYATPVYGWSYPAQLKALIDRHYCLVKWCKGEVASMLFKDKPVALLATCGGSAEYNVDLLQDMFDRNMDYLGSKVIGKYVVPDCTTPAELGEKAKKVAAAMSKDFAAI